VEPFGGAALTAEVIDQVRREDTALAAKVDARLAPQDVPFDVEQTAQAPIPAAYAGARFADVVVTSLADPLVEELVLGVRSPVLAVPKGTAMTDFPSRGDRVGRRDRGCPCAARQPSAAASGRGGPYPHRR
jgi:hypothetical protein